MSKSDLTVSINKPRREYKQGEMLHHFPEGEKLSRGARPPSDEELTLINTKYALQPLDKDAIAVFPVYLANNVIDRDKDRFSEDTLDRFSETLAGKSFLVAHQWGPPGVGRFFQAGLEKGKLENLDGQTVDALWLVGYAYILRKHHEELIDEVNAGTWWATSIGFSWAIHVPIGEDGKELERGSDERVAFWEFREDPEKGLQSEAFEGSLVYLGAQYGAAMGHASKMAGTNVSHDEYVKAYGQLPDGKDKGGGSKPVADDGDKTVIPFKHYPLADIGTAWDGPRNVAQAEVEDLKKMCTWYDAEKPDIKGSYKFPHHLINGYKTVFKGCVAVLVRLKGSSIPEADKKGVYNHVVKHYAEFDKEAPPYKSVMAGEYKGEKEDITMKTVEMTEIEGIRFCPGCGQELIAHDEGKACEGCETLYKVKAATPEPTPEPEPKKEPVPVSMGIDMEALQEALDATKDSFLAAVDEKIKPLADDLRATQDRMDKDTPRKSKTGAFQVDEDGAMLIPIQVKGIGGMRKLSEEEYQKMIQVSPRTGKITRGSVDKFMKAHGLHVIDEAKDLGKPETKEKILDNIAGIMQFVMDEGIALAGD